jgi:predicted double-glycine peptidase
MEVGLFNKNDLLDLIWILKVKDGFKTVFHRILVPKSLNAILVNNFISQEMFYLVISRRGGVFIKRKLICAVLLLFGLALVINVGSVAATNQTNVTVQSSSTVNTAVSTNKTVTTATSTATKVSTNSYGITLTNAKDGLARAQTFYNKNGRLPSYVSFGTKKVPIATFQQILASYGLKIVVKSVPTVWAYANSLTLYHQTTSYTCGPSSLKMELSNYGLTVKEMTLASYAGSTSISGTSHSGLLNAVTKVNMVYGTHLKAWDSKFSTIGWTGLYSYLSKNHPVILHIRSFLSPNSGHYVVLTGLNLKLGLAKIADPSYGYRTITFSSLLTRMNWVVSTGRTTKPLIFVT